MPSRRDAVALLLATTLSLAGGLPASAAPPARVTLPNQTPAFTAQAPRLAPPAPSTPMQVTLWLRPTHPAGLAQLAQEVVTPGSPQRGGFLSPAQFDRLYAPSPAAYAAVASYLTSQGLTVTGTVSNRLFVSAAGTAAQVATAFGVVLGQYTVNGRTVVANANNPSLPAALAADVMAIGGLDGAAIAQPQIHVLGRRSPPLVSPGAQGTPTAAQLCQSLAPDNGATVAGATYVPCPFAPAGLAAAIGLVPSPSGGTAQRIALVEAYGSPTLQQDLGTFDTAFNLPRADVQQIGPSTFTPSNAQAVGWNIETSLDAEWAHALAPQAHLLVYVAPGASALLPTLARVVATRPARLVSLSWGFYESQLPPTELQAADILFEAAAVEGIGVAAAAGDCGNGSPCTGGPPTVDFPASSPFVTAVGGVSLLPGGTVTPWGTTLCAQAAVTPPPVPACPVVAFAGGGGGGYSAVFPSPLWQRSASGMRGVPDVSLDADPFTGLWVTVDGGFLDVGGTSAAAPVFTGLMALANQAAGKPLGLAAPYLYTAASGAIRDVGTQTAGPLLYYSHASGNLYQVGFGYDYGLAGGTGWNTATGLGLPDGSKLVQALAGMGGGSTG